jgi:hypothetical protein
MAITVRMPGSPASVRAVADWLGAVRDRVSDVGTTLASVAGEGNYYWKGKSGVAWRDTLSALRERADPVPQYLRDCVDAFSVYANHLERAQDDLGSLRLQAEWVGLKVVGDTVFPPTTRLDYCPGPGAPKEDLEEYEDYLEKVASYRDLEKQVGTIVGTLDAWVGQNILPLVWRIPEVKTLDGVVDALTANGNEDLARESLTAYEAFGKENLNEWIIEHDALQREADAFRHQLRSGNPALAAAADAADPRAMRAGVEAMAEQIGQASKLSKVLSAGGTAVDIVSLGVDVAEGGSISSGLVELAGGAAGTAGAALVATGPAGVVVATTVIGGIAVGAGSRFMYEGVVSASTRDKIDDFFTGKTPRLKGFSLF